MSNNYVQVQPNSTGLKIDTTELTVGSNTVERQNVCIADPANSAGIASVFPATFLRVTDEPRQVFYDPFDSTLDTTFLWSTPTVGNSAVLASTTSGVMSMGTGTTASGWSKLTSSKSFKPTVPAWLGFSYAIAIPDGAAPTANAYRFWGSGNPATTPTTAAPLTDAIGFELTTAGALVAVVYAAGTRTAVATLSSIGDANYHRYIVYVRTDRIYWYVDSLTNLVATSSFQAPSIQTLPACLLAVGGSTPPASNSQIQCTGAAVWDTGKNATQIADGTYPWRKANVSATGALSVDASGSTLTVGQGTATTGTGWLVRLSDGTNVLSLLPVGTASTPTATISVPTSEIACIVPTYRASGSGLTSVSGALAYLQGSSSKTIRINRILITYVSTSTTAAFHVVKLQRYSALSGGTIVTDTAGSMDINSASATAVSRHVTAVNSTQTTVGGTLLSDRGAAISSTAATTQPCRVEWFFGTNYQQSLVLRGTSDYMGIVFDAATCTVDYTFEWTEE